MPARGVGIGYTTAEITPPELLSTGESIYDPMAGWVGACDMTTQAMYLMYFTCKRTEAVATLVTYTSTPGATATPTKGRMGLYTVDTDDSLIALVASSTNDTALWATANTRYAKANTAGAYTKIKGQRYAFAVHGVSGVALATLGGRVAPGVSIMDTAFGQLPRKTGIVTSQADLPAGPVAIGSIANTRRNFYAEILNV